MKIDIENGKRKTAPITPPIAMSIAGSDSGGCAGIQADLKTIESIGVFGTCAITSITAQNTSGVDSVMAIPVSEVEAQIKSILSDFKVNAAKTGMLANYEIIKMVARVSNDFDFPLVVDPVMISTSGDKLLEIGSEKAYKKLIKNSQMVTPNSDEAEVLSDIVIETTDDAIEAGKKILSMGTESVLVKGGHIPSTKVVDVFVTDKETIEIDHKWIDSDITHGSGCTLSSAIVANIANGNSIKESVLSSISFVERALRYPIDIGNGPGSIHHFATIRELADRHVTLESVRMIITEMSRMDMRSLVPEVGMNIVGATNYAERVEEMAGVEGRITKTSGGVNIGTDIRFGASSHVARFLRESREYHPRLRFAMNCKFNKEIESKIEKIGWETREYLREDQDEKNTMEWGARQVFTGENLPIKVIIDRGAMGKEPMLKLLFETPEEMLSSIEALLN